MSGALKPGFRSLTTLELLQTSLESTHSAIHSSLVLPMTSQQQQQLHGNSWRHCKSAFNFNSTRLVQKMPKHSWHDCSETRVTADLYADRWIHRNIVYYYYFLRVVCQRLQVKTVYPARSVSCSYKKQCCRKETARCRSCSFRFKVRRRHSLVCRRRKVNDLDGVAGSLARRRPVTTVTPATAFCRGHRSYQVTSDRATYLSYCHLSVR